MTGFNARRRAIRAVVSVAAATAAAMVAQSTHAAPFSGGVIVARMGGTDTFGGAASAPAATGTQIFLDEFSLDGTGSTPIQTIALPTTDGTGGQKGIVDAGSSNNAGYVNRTGDGGSVVISGYDVGVGNAVGGVATTNLRIFGRVDASGAVDTSTGYSQDGSPNNNASLRSASASGNNYYAGTANSAATTRYINTPGAIDSATDGVGGGQVRTIGIFGGRLFTTITTTFSSVKDTATGGLPVGPASQNTTSTFTIASSNNEQFAMADLDPNVNFDGTGLDTLYMSDLGAVAGTVNPAGPAESGGGLQKYTWNGTSWVLQYTLNQGLSTAATDRTSGGIEGVAFVGVDDSGNPILFATTVSTAAVGNALMRIVDSGAASSSFTLVANSPTNTMFRGVAAPLPEPTGCGLLGLGAFGLLRRRRRAR